ncbi:hypothetical protein PLANPX_4546 [Lacipirellula parvula]|uniref:Uncharacterized protein n=1 Tax=Lacipirellula parvula TaxID=2650471 RepID=A0A5K7XDN7_9BACT|nr:hypothetical protein PLANPX_4546 [Lacipirellula parvula]
MGVSSASRDVSLFRKPPSQKSQAPLPLSAVSLRHLALRFVLGCAGFEPYTRSTTQHLCESFIDSSQTLHQHLLRPPNNRDRRLWRQHGGFRPNPRRCYPLTQLEVPLLASTLLFGILRRSNHPGHTVPGSLTSSRAGSACPVRRDPDTFARRRAPPPSNRRWLRTVAPPELGYRTPRTCHCAPPSGAPHSLEPLLLALTNIMAAPPARVQRSHRLLSLLPSLLSTSPSEPGRPGPGAPPRTHSYPTRKRPNPPP